MPERIYVGTKPHHRDSAGENVRNRIASDLGIGTASSVRIARVYILNGAFSTSELIALANGPLSDPIIQDYSINGTFCTTFDWLVEVGFRPGVTDNAGRTAKEAVAVCLKRDDLDAVSVHTASQFFIQGKISKKLIERISRELLANELIQTIAIYSKQEWLGIHTRVFAAPIVTDTHAITPFVPIDLAVSDDALLSISKKGMLALTLDEMKIIANHFAAHGSDPARKACGLPASATNVELEILAQTWSEHCKHKIFAAHITYLEEGRSTQTISSLFKVYIQGTTETVRSMKGAADICLSVFKDNAGVVRFNDTWAIVFKCETHNSPSALDPYGGALTGIVGVNRDPFGTGMGCQLIANTDVFCFASPFYTDTIPPRILHPKRVFEGVREGVEHGGNKSGIPTINGTIVFDDRFLGKPLVHCGTLGLMPLVINGQKGYEKKALIGDRIVMVGGRIGKDGIHGATFSSEALHEGSPATAVQIGDPITQKRMTDFLLAARDKNLYSSITDNGAGGLSSSIGEMAQDTNGAIVHLDRAPLKYHGLEPWEIFVSEAQERMTLAVPPSSLNAFMALSREWNVESSDVGEFTNSGHLDIRYNEQVVAFLSMDFLHNGLPKMQLTARWTQPKDIHAGPLSSSDHNADLLGLLKRLNICSKEYVIRQYDHEVQGGSVVKPLVGVKNDGPSDAAVIRPILESFEGIAVSNGIIPRYSDIDTYAMASSSVDEAVRNAVAVGADPDYMAGLDNFCWCDPVPSAQNPDGEYKLAQLVRANQALYDLCINYGIPLISGKDSMKNDYHIGDTRISIPPSLLISVVGKVHDVRKSVTMDFKKADNIIYVVGTTYREIGASEYALMKGIADTSVPKVHEPSTSMKMYRAMHTAMQAALVRSCHDCSDGGLAVALAEMCFSGELGATIELSRIVNDGCTTNTELLFSESTSRFIVEVEPARAQAFESCLSGLPCAAIGTVTRQDAILVTGLTGEKTLSLSRIDAKIAWKSTLTF